MQHLPQQTLIRPVVVVAVLMLVQLLVIAETIMWTLTSINHHRGQVPKMLVKIVRRPMKIISNPIAIVVNRLHFDANIVITLVSIS